MCFGKLLTSLFTKPAWWGRGKRVWPCLVTATMIASKFVENVFGKLKLLPPAAWWGKGKRARPCLVTATILVSHVPVRSRSALRYNSQMHKRTSTQCEMQYTIVQFNVRSRSALRYNAQMHKGKCKMHYAIVQFNVRSGSAFRYNAQMQKRTKRNVKCNCKTWFTFTDWNVHCAEHWRQLYSTQSANGSMYCANC